MDGDLDQRRSTTGYVFTMAGEVVSLISRLQKVIALSTTEEEYIAMIETTKDMILLQRLLSELGNRQKERT
jgi:hypothetical protein